MKTIPTISDLDADVSGFVKRAQTEGIIPISNRGRTVVFLVGREELAALLETMELQGDLELMKLVKADKAGKVKLTPVPDAI